MTVLLATMRQFAEFRGVDYEPSDVRSLRALEDASAFFRAIAKQTISLVEDDEVELQGTEDGRLRLPERPVIAVSLVSVVTDSVLTPTVLAATDYVVSRRGHLNGIWGPGWAGGDATVQVKYSHGYAVIPDDVVAVVTSMAARRLGENVGTPETTGTLGLSEDEMAVAKRYRMTL